MEWTLLKAVVRRAAPDIAVMPRLLVSERHFAQSTVAERCPEGGEGINGLGPAAIGA